MEKLVYASAQRRFLAYLIDVCVIVGLFMALGIVLGAAMIMALLKAFLPIFGIWWYIGVVFVFWLYFACLESSSWQATIGKRCLKLEVADLNGNRISFWRATARYVSKFFSRWLLFFGFIMIFFTQKKQALHDKIAKTVILIRG